MSKADYGLGTDREIRTDLADRRTGLRVPFSAPLLSASSDRPTVSFREAAPQPVMAIHEAKATG